MFFTEQHELIRKLARDFAEQEIEPIADEVDKTAEFPKEIVKKNGPKWFLWNKNA